jgi:hypothetical protein
MRSSLNLKSAILTMCLSLAAAWHVHAAAFDSAEASLSASPVPAVYKQGQNILAEDLSKRFNVHVMVDGDQLSVVGTRKDVEQLIATFNDLDALSALYMPISHSDISINILDKPYGTWAECADAIGVSQEAPAFNLKVTHDDGRCVHFPIDTPPNRQMTNAYVTVMKSTLNKLHWFGRSANPSSHASYVDGLFRTTDTGISFDYSIINQFLGKITLTETEGGGNSDDLIRGTIPLQPLLQHIIAASHGDAHLVETEKPDVFDVRTTSLGEGSGCNTFDLELVFDCSSSMQGNPIALLNEKAPELLRLVQRKLPEGAVVNVKLFSFSNALIQGPSFALTSTSNITWQKLNASGSTDLTCLGERIRNQGDSRKLLVGFTDGEHTAAGSLSASKTNINKYIHDGQIAYPYFHFVGADAAKSDPYLSEIAQAAGGRYSTSSDMTDFFNDVISKLDELLEARRNFRFNFVHSGLQVIWQPAGRPGVFATGVTVEPRDTVNGITVAVPQSARVERSAAGGARVSTSEQSMAELIEEIARLKLELAANKSKNATT